MPDDADWCCAAGQCCNAEKRRKKLAHLIKGAVPDLASDDALAVADFLHDKFDLTPKAWGFGAALEKAGEDMRAHPYE